MEAAVIHDGSHSQRLPAVTAAGCTFVHACFAAFSLQIPLLLFTFLKTIYPMVPCCLQTETMWIVCCAYWASWLRRQALWIVWPSSAYWPGVVNTSYRIQRNKYVIFHKVRFHTSRSSSSSRNRLDKMKNRWSLIENIGMRQKYGRRKFLQKAFCICLLQVGCRKNIGVIFYKYDFGCDTL